MLLALMGAATRLRLEGTAEFADPGWDRHYYLQAARDGPWDFHIAPYCWRVLVPLVAWASPLPLQWTFFAIAAAALAGAGAALWTILREEGLPAPLAAAGVLLMFSAGWGVRYQLADFWLPDAAATAAIVLAMRFARQGRPGAFALALLAGTLAKEATLAAAPLAFTLPPGESPLRVRALRAAAMTAPALAAAVAVRLAIPAWNDDPAYLASLPPVISRFPEIVANYDYAVLLREVGWDQRVRGFDGDLAQALTTRTFGPVVLLLAAAGAAVRPGLALRLAPFAALVLAQLLVARDTERLIAFAAPAAAWLAAAGADELCRRGWARPGQAAVVAGGVFALALVSEPNAFALDVRDQAALAGASALALAFERVRVSLRG
ncbi:MAG: hypothetical protein K6U88_01405 [Dehalococcoidia bacterium]|nr:hypothetical protein [Dehalococcoidia bacterium]